MKGKIRTLIVFESFAAFIGIVSAIGSSCPTFNPTTDTSSALYIMNELQWVFIITTLLTYVAAIVSGGLIWALISRKTWFYPVALATSVVGLASGLIPSLLVISNGMSFSPSLMRTVVYGIVLLLLLLPPFYELRFKTSERDSEAPSKFSSDSTEKIDTKTTIISTVSLMLMSIGMGLFIQPFMVTSSHIIDGVNYFINGHLYIYFGIALMVASVILFVSYTYLRRLSTSKNQNKLSI
jgi:hypothetical protein